MEILLEHGCDINRANKDGTTALHVVAQRGDLKLADFLFGYEANLDARDNQGRTPADLALAQGHENIADAIRAEDMRRRGHGGTRDRSAVPGSDDEGEAVKRPRVERED
jgi:hypothetical protein